MKRQERDRKPAAEAPKPRRRAWSPFARRHQAVAVKNGPGRLEAAGWFAVAIAILAAGARAPRAHVPAPRPPMPYWRRLFSSNLGTTVQQQVRSAEASDPGRGRDAHAPSQIPARGWRDVLYRTWEEFNGDRIPAVAGSVAYFSLLAVFPAMAAFVSLYGLFADVHAVREQLDLLAGLLPRDALLFVGDQMMRLADGQDSSLGLAFVFSVLLSLLSANAGMKALFDGLNIAYEEKEKRGLVRLNAVALLFTFATLVFVSVVMAAVIALPVALSILGYSGANPMWMLRWPLLLGIIIFGLAVLYRYGPSRAKARWRWVSWGSVAAAVLWVCASMAFSWYVANFANYNRTYGSLGAVIGFMTWIWLSIIVVLLGAELNAEIEHQTAVDSTTGPPEPMGQRHAKMADTLGKSADRLKAEPKKPKTPAMSGDKLGPKR